MEDQRWVNILARVICQLSIASWIGAILVCSQKSVVEHTFAHLTLKQTNNAKFVFIDVKLKWNVCMWVCTLLPLFCFTWCIFTQWRWCRVTQRRIFGVAGVEFLQAGFPSSLSTNSVKTVNRCRKVIWPSTLLSRTSLESHFACGTPECWCEKSDLIRCSRVRLWRWRSVDAHFS